MRERFLDIMEAERKTTEQGKFTEQIETVRKKIPQSSKHEEAPNEE